MANQVDIGNNSILIIKIPARGATDWAAEFKANFADEIAEHDHTTGKGARITNAALVTNTMVSDGKGVTKVDGTFTAYTSADVAVSTDTIQDSAVTTAKIANDAVDGTKIADNSITADHIVDGTIIAADVANDAITTDKILDANVTTAKIANDAVTLDKLEKTVVITQDTTITQNTSNTHFILQSSSSASTTLTFQSTSSNPVKVNGCLFTNGHDELYSAIVKLEGTDIQFKHNTIDMVGVSRFDINSVDLDDYHVTYNNITVEQMLANVDGTATGVSGSTAGGQFSYNNLHLYSINSDIKFPFGQFNNNKIEIKQPSSTKVFQDHVVDSDTSTKYSNHSGASNNIIFNAGTTYKTATSGQGVTTITDTKPFRIIDRTTKVSLDPALADLKDVSLSTPSTGDRLEWNGTEWAPIQPIFGEFSATVPTSTPGTGSIDRLDLSSVTSQGMTIGSTQTIGGDFVTLSSGTYLVTLTNFVFQGGGASDAYYVTGISGGGALYESDYGADRNYSYILNVASSTDFEVRYDDDGQSSNPAVDLIIVRI